jgi:hypothetical protein
MPHPVSRAEVPEIVERSPTDTLTYADKAGLPEAPPAEDGPTVAQNAPLYRTGDPQILRCRRRHARRAFPHGAPSVRASKNKPFCDNSHVEAKFKRRPVPPSPHS